MNTFSYLVPGVWFVVEVDASSRQISFRRGHVDEYIHIYCFLLVQPTKEVDKK